MARVRSLRFVRARDPNEPYYDTQQVCENGHQITDSYHDRPQHRRDFCEKCGKKTIYTCQKCGAEIKGEYNIPGAAIGGGTPVPEHCHKCGTPYPWAGKKKPGEEPEVSPPEDPLKLIELIASRFHVVARQMRSRHDGRPTLDVTDEYDVQDLMHTLLSLFFDDIRPEEWTPSYAGGSSRMDFLLKQESIVVETKKTGPTHGGKEIGEELIVDITKYREHPYCKKLFCTVYDPEERITNPRGLEKDLGRKEGDLEIRVIITPRRS
jgi:hypothetical protein